MYIGIKCVSFGISVLYLISIYGTTNAKHDSKRILLNDPEIAGKITQMDGTIKALTQQLVELNAKLNAQETEIKQQRSLILSQQMTIQNYMSENDANRVKSKDIGATYLRWGRSDCSGPNSTLIYSGFTTGQHPYGYTNRFGGPSDFLCLPSDPELTNITLHDYSFLYGTEYRMNIQRSDADQEDVPCALCKSRHSAVVMIPGRKTCYPGWNVEYTGLIASDYYGSSASRYICVDNNPEYVQGGQTHQASRELYYTQTKCGALPCPPYKDNYAVNCVVCSQ